MKKNNLLTIIIVNYNTYPFLQKCLKSIIAENISGIFPEIIIVDNASSDDSVRLIRTNFPEIELIANRTNLGFAKANNIGITKARGKYILLLNPDTQISGGVLKKMVGFMESDSNAAVSTCRVELADGSLDDACHRGFPTPWNSFCHFTGLGSLFPSSLIFNGYHLGYRQMDKIHEIDSCTGAFMLVRRTAGEAAGWLDEDYFWYGEDLDFCFKIKAKGGKVYFVPDVKVLHYKGVSSGIKKQSRSISTASKETRIRVNKARFEVMRIFFRKHYSGRYPRMLMFLVFAVIAIKENINKIIYKLRG